MTGDLIRSAFSRSPSLNELFLQMIRKLGSQHAYLELIAARLRERSRSMFSSCQSAIRGGHRERAAVYASELAEVKKLTTTVTQAQLAIEQVILRLETMREMESVTRDLRSALDVTQDVAEKLTAVMPRVASEMNKLSTLVAEMLDTTVVDSTPPITAVAVRDEETEEILRETSFLAERDLRAKIPEPPAGVAAGVPEPSERIEVAVLAAGSSEVSEGFQRPAEDRLSSGAAEPRGLPYGAQRSSVENWVVAYARQNTGKVDIAKDASELNEPSEDVKKALEALDPRQKIKVTT